MKPAKDLLAMLVAFAVILAVAVPAFLWQDWRTTLMMIGAAIVATLVFRTWADKHRGEFQEAVEGVSAQDEERLSEKKAI